MNRQHALTVANELESLVGVAPKDAAAAPLGGVYALVLALAVAVRSGDPQRIWTAFKTVGDSLFGSTVDPVVATAMIRPASGIGGFDWTKLVTILAKVLPLLLS